MWCSCSFRGCCSGLRVLIPAAQYMARSRHQEYRATLFPVAAGRFCVCLSGNRRAFSCLGARLSVLLRLCSIGNWLAGGSDAAAGAGVVQPSFAPVTAAPSRGGGVGSSCALFWPVTHSGRDDSGHGLGDHRSSDHRVFSRMNGKDCRSFEASAYVYLWLRRRLPSSWRLQHVD